MHTAPAMLAASLDIGLQVVHKDRAGPRGTKLLGGQCVNGWVWFGQLDVA